MCVFTADTKTEYNKTTYTAQAKCYLLIISERERAIIISSTIDAPVIVRPIASHILYIEENDAHHNTHTSQFIIESDQSMCVSVLVALFSRETQHIRMCLSVQRSPQSSRMINHKRARTVGASRASAFDTPFSPALARRFLCYTSVIVGFYAV